MKSFLIAALSVSSLTLTAAEAAEAAKEETQRTCRILLVGNPPETVKDAYLFDGTNSHKVPLSSLNFSEIITLPPGEITLALSPATGQAAVDFPDAGPSASISDQVKDFLLLVKSHSDNPNQLLELTVIDVSNNRLKPGETLWINQSPHNISAQLGLDKLTIPAMKRSIWRPSQKDSGYYKASFKYQRNGKGEFLSIMRKSWWFDASSKNIGFIVETEARLPKIYTIRDHR